MLLLHVASANVAGTILLQEGWQGAHGDFTFDTDKFPNSSAMISEITSQGFDVGKNR